MLAERGIDVSYETIRRWILKFGPAIAANVRSRRVQPSGMPLALASLALAQFSAETTGLVHLDER